MAIVNKATIKTYFEQGDIPTQGQYFNFIDSTFNLADDEVQNVKGTLSASSADFGDIRISKAYFPGVGVGTAVVGKTFTIGKTIEVMGSAMINASGSDPGNLTVAGELSTNTLSITGGTLSASGHIVTKHFSASSNISGSKIQSHQNIIHYKGIEGGMSIEKGFVVGPALVVSGSISSSANLIARNITASSNISASTFIAQSFKFPDNNNVLNEGDIKIQNSSNDETTNLYQTATGDTYLQSPQSFYVSIDHPGESTDDIFVIGDSTLPGVVGSIFFKVDSNSDISQIRNITGSGFITASGAIHSDGNISSSAQVTCEHLFSSDDAEITDNITVGGNATITGNVSTDGYFSGDNMGPYMDDIILVLPTDFSLGNSAGKDGVFATNGAKVSVSDTSISIIASYVLPKGKSVRTAAFYGDSGVVINVYEGSIATSTTTQLISDGGTGTTIALSPISSTGDGLLYITIKLTFGATSDYFHGGKLTFG